MFEGVVGRGRVGCKDEEGKRGTVTFCGHFVVVVADLLYALAQFAWPVPRLPWCC